MMTEREAWLRIAQSFREAGPDFAGNYFNSMGGFGICYSIEQLRFWGQISAHMVKRMHRKINRLPSSLKDPLFKWPTTKYGARKRVEFCKKQAEFCGQKRNKK